MVGRKKEGTTTTTTTTVIIIGWKPASARIYRSIDRPEGKRIHLLGWIVARANRDCLFSLERRGRIAGRGKKELEDFPFLLIFFMTFILMIITEFGTAKTSFQRRKPQPTNQTKFFFHLLAYRSRAWPSDFFIGDLLRRGIWRAQIDKSYHQQSNC